MIARYRFEVLGTSRIPAAHVYAFYSYLLSLVSDQTAELFHAQGETPISQFLYHNKHTGQTIWQISLLGQETVTEFSKVLDSLTKLNLNTGDVQLRLLERLHYSSSEIIMQAKQLPTNRFTTLNILTPMAFKRNGRYIIFPEEWLVLQSLLNKWDSTFPAYPLNDENVTKILLDKIHIIDYSLYTTRYRLKDVRIPGCCGKLTLYAPLSAPIMEIWNLLLYFSEFSGIGIKTTLGMGGIARYVSEKK